LTRKKEGEEGEPGVTVVLFIGGPIVVVSKYSSTITLFPLLNYELTQQGHRLQPKLAM
jgi:hypothetical protein